MIETITHPWRNPIDYVKLAFWIAIFLIVALAIGDGLRVVGSYVRSAV